MFLYVFESHWTLRLDEIILKTGSAADKHDEAIITSPYICMKVHEIITLNNSVRIRSVFFKSVYQMCSSYNSVVERADNPSLPKTQRRQIALF